MSNNIAGHMRNGRKGLMTVLSIIKKTSFSAVASTTNSPSIRINNFKRSIWHSAGVPAVDANSHTTYPIKVGDFAIDTTNSNAYICSVAPTANTAATFILMNVTNA